MTGEDRAREPGGAPAQERALRAQGRRTVATLLEAGLTVFDVRGYHAARVDDIVKRARTSHGTFYLYFANKEDLFGVLAEECVAAVDALAADLGPVAPDSDGFSALRDWLARFGEIYRRYGPVLRTWAEALTSEPALARLGARSLDDLAGRLAARITEANPGLDPTIAALAMLATVERLNYYVVSRRLGDGTDGELLDTLTAFLHTGVFGAPGT